LVKEKAVWIVIKRKFIHLQATVGRHSSQIIAVLSTMTDLHTVIATQRAYIVNYSIKIIKMAVVKGGFTQDINFGSK
jgi:hypothetical protein